ncbi:protoheme IX farnesyltransferase, mitochondrial [Orussus abietinus]|uniref:protoheme IX farnesyltransferase, mitochondrial n=1 Tax=Orussus abietinus TaxID=222816 RepID=UPI000625F5FF|nr:protoheme IX farnesyltransferase, mitochondrial [Orussus abietinus]XP_012272904.1 protoheme IX farnesyltransferase, mitochondrial [Orussus abietinus]XP_012272905.1 protoheme IX farnesyltransferase, mitochondrial [Orussus abietinus]XP_023290357.1 protoheme IX farnesyltransferase, mitochondrial [Orussus abietinus]
MIFILYSTTRFCRNVPCLPLSKIITTTYSAKAAQAVKKIPQTLESPCLTIGEKFQPCVVTTDLPPSNLRKGHLETSRCATLAQVDSITIGNDKVKRKQLVQESEWRPMILDFTKLHKYCLMLSKIRLTSLVVITTMGGYALAPAPFDLYTFIMCSVGTGLVSATANTINQFFEIPFDAQMSRTKNRVLVRGYLTPAEAVSFAVISGVLGLSTLYYQVNGVTAALGAANLILYTVIYTPLKRISILNTWVGSIVGAIPPLMGWAGCAGDILSPGAWIMSGMLYAWQFPHFNALSWNLRPDYSRAGYRMMAVTDPGLCRRTALRYTAILMGLSYLAPVLDVTNFWFAVASTPLNAYFLYLAWRFNRNSDSASSRKLFRFSLVHLPALMVLMLLSKKYWTDGKEKVDNVPTSEVHQQTSFSTIFPTLSAPTSASI